MPDSELDIQIIRPEFVVDRAPDAKRHYSRTGKPVQPKSDGSYVIRCVLAYAKSGTAYYIFNGGRRHVVNRGNVLFIRQDDSSEGVSDPDDPWSYYSCAFDMLVADEASMERLRDLPRIFRCSASTHMRERFAQLARAWAAKQTGYLLKCRCMLLDILFILLWDEKRRAIHSAHYKTIDDIVELMRENIEKSYSPEELSSRSGLSGSYFRMLFKQMTGCTPVQFQNRLRIEKAKDLILSGSCNVPAAARAVGFSDVFYFSRMFKKLTGKNPSEYRE